MNKTEAMQRLKALGTAQNRKVYARHGVGGEQFGVSYANLKKLVREVQLDHALASSLWKTGNHDARVFATMIADADSLTAKDLNAWVKDLDSYVLTDAFSAVASRSPAAKSRMQAWIKSRKVWISSCGWTMLSYLAGSGQLTEAELRQYLDTIEAGIHGAPNRTRYSMNNAVISIGMQSAALEKLAIAAARRIGAVEVDHGETGCKTPDAVTYIPKARAHRQAKATGKKAPARKPRSKA